MAAELLLLCREAVFSARRILEVGCGTGYFTALLRQVNSTATLVALDLDTSLLQRARARLGADPRVHFVAADGEAFCGGGFDLIVSNSVFQWFSRPGETLREYYQILRPGGSLAFATLGPATFRELAGAFREATGTLPLAKPPKIVALSFSGKEKWQRFLSNAGFQRVQVQRQMLSESHPTVQDFLRALQATGASNPVPQPLPPGLYRRMAANYLDTFGVNGSIPVTYEVIWAIAQKQDFSLD
jgi:malonyl-CoA O-methyltransferase